MSALRIKGDLANMPKPTKGLNKRIEEKSCHKLRCPQCGEEKPARQFFYLRRPRSEGAEPTVVRNPGGRCNSCKHRPRGGKKRRFARVRTN